MYLTDNTYLKGYKYPYDFVYNIHNGGSYCTELNFLGWHNSHYAKDEIKYYGRNNSIYSYVYDVVHGRIGSKLTKLSNLITEYNLYVPHK